MKMYKSITICILAVFLFSSGAFAQTKQEKKPVEKTSTCELGKVATDAVMHPEYVKTIGKMAYVWGWPMVNSHNRRATITQAPEAGRLGGVVPVAPRGYLSMLNDTDEDRTAIQSILNQINGYPLKDYTGEVQIKDWSKTPSFPTPPSEGENKWVVPEVFFDHLPGVMDLVPPLPGEEALYASIEQVLRSG